MAGKFANADDIPQLLRKLFDKDVMTTPVTDKWAKVPPRAGFLREYSNSDFGVFGEVLPNLKHTQNSSLVLHTQYTIALWSRIPQFLNLNSFNSESNSK